MAKFHLRLIWENTTKFRPHLTQPNLGMGELG